MEFCKKPSSDRASSVEWFNQTSICGLLFYCCPSTILRTVVTIIVDTVNTVTRSWSRPHIFIEVFKRVFPLMAYSYTSTAISMITNIFWIVTTSLHIIPNAIFWSFTQIMGRISFYKLFNSKASTTRSVSIPKRATGNNVGIPTRTQTFPHCYSIAAFSFGNYSKSTKFLSGKIDELRHNNLQAKVASIKRCVASWLLGGQRFGSYPSHIKSIAINFNNVNKLWGL